MAEFTPDPSPGGGFTPDAPKSAPFSLARAGESAAKTGRVALGLDEPKSLADTALQLMTTAPITAGGGALLKGAPWLGRVLAQTGLGAGQAASRGESVAGGAAKDAGASLLAELIASAIGRGRIPFTKLSLSESGVPARAFDYASKAPAAALEKIRGMLPVQVGPWMNVPAISSKTITPDEAIKKLVTLEGNDYRMAYEQIVTEFNALGKTGFGKKAGDWFREFTSEQRFMPSAGSRTAERARRSLVPDKDLPNPPLRAGLDALSSVEIGGGVPIGPAAVLGLIGASPESLGSIASRMGRQ